MIRFDDAPPFWMPRVLRILCALALVLVPVSARAQLAIAGWDLSSERQERIGEDHLRFSGNVEIKQGDTSLFAEVIEVFTNQDRAVATGNVVFTQGANRISADRADFNTKTRLGTFYNATGIASIQPPRQAPQPGAFAAPQLIGQDTDVFFFGESVEKLGPKKYKIKDGGFTTCVQPTPRWNLQADTVVLNIDHYTTLRQAVFTVKGVPMLYLPFMYYPTNKDNRATGFLIPTYGISTLQGQSIHNAFFWAINRSQDATFLHDWFSKTGQGVGTRVPLQLRRRIRRERPRLHARPARGDVPAGRRHDRRPCPRARATRCAAARTRRCRGGCARARTSTTSRASRRCRRSTPTSTTPRATRARFGGNVVGAWGTYTLNATLNRNQYFFGTHELVGHRLRAERPVHAQRAAAVRHAVLLLGHHGVRQPAARRENGRVARRQHRAVARRLLPDDPVSLQEVAVVHGELVVRLARHVLLAQLRDRPGDAPAGGRPGHRPERDRRHRPRPALLHDRGADGRPRVHADLGHADQRLRGEVQAHDRAVPEHPADLVDRQLQRDRPARRQRLHRRRDDAVHLRGEQPDLREAAPRARPARAVARDPDGLAHAELLHERPGVAVRPAVRVQPVRDRACGHHAEQLLADPAGRAIAADQRLQR